MFARDRKWLSEARAKSANRTSEVQAIRIGPLGIVSNAAEFFASDGLRVKAASPFASTWVATLTNDALGYVPPASSFFAGGYEPRTGGHSFLAPDAAQRHILEYQRRGHCSTPTISAAMTKITAIDPTVPRMTAWGISVGPCRTDRP